MRKKGDIDINVLQWTLSIILLAFTIATLLAFVENSANGVNFKKSFLARDSAILINTIYLSPGITIVEYPINDVIYSFNIGKFEEGYRVKIGDVESKLDVIYRYVEDSFFRPIRVKIGDAYNINGIILIKDDKGIVISDKIPDINEAMQEQRSGYFLALVSFLRPEEKGVDERKTVAEMKAINLNAAWPVVIKEASYVITSCYGDRDGMKKEGSPCGKDHCGVDIRAIDEKGNVHDIVSVADGRVVKIVPAYGEVDILHDSVLVKYLHMDISNGVEKGIYVKVGQDVKIGQRLGRAGTTSPGRADIIDDAPHLHLSVVIDNRHFDPLEIGLFDKVKFSFKQDSNCNPDKYMVAKKK